MFSILTEVKFKDFKDKWVKAGGQSTIRPVSHDSAVGMYLPQSNLECLHSPNPVVIEGTSGSPVHTGEMLRETNFDVLQ